MGHITPWVIELLAKTHHCSPRHIAEHAFDLLLVLEGYSSATTLKAFEDAHHIEVLTTVVERLSSADPETVTMTIEAALNARTDAREVGDSLMATALYLNTASPPLSEPFLKALASATWREEDDGWRFPRYFPVGHARELATSRLDKCGRRA